jgi:hypothetical protein
MLSAVPYEAPIYKGVNEKYLRNESANIKIREFL